MVDPSSKPFVWLGVLASITGILGFLAQVGLAPIFDPLKLAVPIPLWLGLIIAVLLWLGAMAMVERATRRALDELRSTGQRLSETEAKVMRLTGELTASTAKMDEKAADRDSVELLRKYESLEQEIMGLLRSGARMTLAQIVDATSVALYTDRRERVTRAIASLGDRIEGNDGWYRLSNGVSPRS